MLRRNSRTKISSSIDNRKLNQGAKGYEMFEIGTFDSKILFGKSNYESIGSLTQELDQRKQTMHEWHRHNRVKNPKASHSTYTKKDISFELSSTRPKYTYNIARQAQSKQRNQTIDPISVLTDKDMNSIAQTKKTNKSFEVNFNSRIFNTRSTDHRSNKGKGAFDRHQYTMEDVKINTSNNFKNSIGFQSSKLTDSKINLSNDRIDLLICQDDKTFKCSKKCYKEIVKKDQLNKKLMAV